MMQLRGNSRITGGEGGPQTMTARDIDLTYAGDGRTLQSANLMEQASVQMAGAAARQEDRRADDQHRHGPGRIHGDAPRGEQNVQVDIPSENNAPAKRIRSATLVASGAPDAGLKSATFGGKVEFRETQPACGEEAGSRPNGAIRDACRRDEARPRRHRESRLPRQREIRGCARHHRGGAARHLLPREGSRRADAVRATRGRPRSSTMAGSRSPPAPSTSPSVPAT